MVSWLKIHGCYKWSECDMSACSSKVLGREAACPCSEDFSLRHHPIVHRAARGPNQAPWAARQCIEVRQVPILHRRRRRRRLLLRNQVGDIVRMHMAPCTLRQLLPLVCRSLAHCLLQHGRLMVMSHIFGLGVYQKFCPFQWLMEDCVLYFQNSGGLM